MTTTELSGSSHHAARAVARGGLANLGGAVVSAVANFALVVILARALPATGAGAFFAVTSVFLLLETVTRLGADVSCVYFIARWRALGHDDRIGPGLRTALVPTVLIAAVAGAAMVVSAPWLSRAVAGDADSGVTLLRVLGVLLPVVVGYDLVLSMTRGFAAMRPTVLIEKVARPLAQVALIAVVLVAGWHGGVGYAWAAPYLVAALAGVLALRRFHPVWPMAQADSAVAREFWRFSLPRAAASVAQIALQRLDILLVAAMRGPRDAAIYTVVTRFLVVGQFINQAIGVPLQPRLSAALSTGARDTAKTLYRMTTTWLILTSWPVFGVAVVFAPTYVALFGKAYASSAAIVVVLAGAMFLATLIGPVDNVTIMAGKSSWNLWTTAAALVVNVGLNLALIPALGVMGAAIAWCVAIAITNVVPLILVWRGLALHPFGRSTLTAAVLAGVAFLAVPLLAGWLIPGQRLIGSAIGLAVGIVGYLVACRRARDQLGLVGLLTLRRERS